MIAMQIPPATRSECRRKKNLKRKRQKKLAASLLLFVVSVLGVTCGLTRLAVDAEASALIAAVLDAQVVVDGSDVNNQGTSHIPARKLGPWVTSDVSASRGLMEAGSSSSNDVAVPGGPVHLPIEMDPDGLGVVHVVMIVQLPSEEGDVSFPSSARFAKYFEGCVGSILSHASRMPVHFILLTGKGTEKLFRKAVVKLAVARSRVPVYVDSMDLDAITSNLTSSLKRLRSHLPSAPRTKYAAPLFHVGPLLPYVTLPGRPNRVIVLDVDLKFRVDVSHLQEVFNSFGKEKTMAMAPELSPLYRKSFEAHRKRFSGSKLGLPRPGFQGLNSGVALFDLARLRRSDYYSNLVRPSSEEKDGVRLGEDPLDRLIEKFSFEPSGVGDQDFFTLLAAERPDWIHHLDCSWNAQLDLTLNTPANAEYFHRYHNCCDPQDVKVYHGNSGYPIPGD